MILDCTKHCNAVRTKILFGDCVESYDSSSGGNIEGFGEE